jgi:hypothetical protein
MKNIQKLMIAASLLWAAGCSSGSREEQGMDEGMEADTSMQTPPVQQQSETYQADTMPAEEQPMVPPDSVPK